MLPYFSVELDVGATAINEEMKMACVRAIAALARKRNHHQKSQRFTLMNLSRIRPQIHDPKTLWPAPDCRTANGGCQTTMETGVATRPIEDWEAYKTNWPNSFINPTRSCVLSFLKRAPTRKIAYWWRGRRTRIARRSTVVDEQLARPVLVGRRAVIESRIEKLHLRMKLDQDFDLVDPEHDERYHDYWTTYHAIMERNGVSPSHARNMVRTNTTVIGALLVNKGKSRRHDLWNSCSIPRTFENNCWCYRVTPGRWNRSSHGSVCLHQHAALLFICDTHINPDPSVAQISEMTMLATEEIRRFGIIPKVALISIPLSDHTVTTAPLKCVMPITT